MHKPLVPRCQLLHNQGACLSGCLLPPLPPLSQCSAGHWVQHHSPSAAACARRRQGSPRPPATSWPGGTAPPSGRTAVQRCEGGHSSQRPKPQELQVSPKWKASGYTHTKTHIKYAQSVVYVYLRMAGPYTCDTYMPTYGTLLGLAAQSPGVAHESTSRIPEARRQPPEVPAQRSSCGKACAASQDSGLLHANADATHTR